MREFPSPRGWSPSGTTEPHGPDGADWSRRTEPAPYCARPTASSQKKTPGHQPQPVPGGLDV